jgi:hypothetical protein
MNLPKPPADAPDAKKPRSMWDMIFTSTPVVMTVLATILAGLSSSEISQAQYYRSLAAQSQSKAGDQWNFFQAKKLRSTDSANAAELLQNLGDVAPLSAESLRAAVAQVAAVVGSAVRQAPADALARVRGAADEMERALAGEDLRTAIEAMSGPLPPVADLKISDQDLRRAYEAVRTGNDDPGNEGTFAAVSDRELHKALLAANENVLAADEELKPATDGIAKLQKLLNRLAGAAAATRGYPRAAASRAASQVITTGAASQPAVSDARPATATALASPSDRGTPPPIRQLAADFAAAHLRFEAARHEREAKLNQQKAYLYEVAVRKSSFESERHRIRSRYFFFGMLAAQAAVTIATISLAVKERSWLWTVAATIGVMALSYAAYVYLFT